MFQPHSVHRVRRSALLIVGLKETCHLRATELQKDGRRSVVWEGNLEAELLMLLANWPPVMKVPPGVPAEEGWRARAVV